MQTKLILVEGIPGSGKSTASEMINQYLKDHQVTAVLYQEGNTDHPADFEGVACLTLSQYEELLREFSGHVEIIKALTDQNVDDYFIHYLSGIRNHNKSFPDSLINRLEQFDVYALPIEKYCKLILERWTNFAKQAEQQDEVTIFECCFLQNPLNTLLARDNRPVEEIKSFMIELAQIIKKLNPIIIYYYQDDVKETIDRVRGKRSKEALKRMV